MFRDDTPSASDTQVALTALRQAGVAKVEIHFSGGNDEGGADGIDYFDAEGANIDSIPTSNAYEQRAWDAETKSYGPSTWQVNERNSEGKYKSRPADENEVRWAKVRTVLEFPIYDRFGSFAGEFYVDGILTWDVVAGTNEMHGQEEVRHWESF